MLTNHHHQQQQQAAAAAIQWQQQQQQQHRSNNNSSSNNHQHQQPYASSNDRQNHIQQQQQQMIAAATNPATIAAAAATAAAAMQNFHHNNNLNNNSNNNQNNGSSCSSCRELKRELDLLRHFVAKLMENKPDLLCAAPPLFGLLSPPSQHHQQQQQHHQQQQQQQQQRSSALINPQSFITTTDSPFSIPVMPNLPNPIPLHQILRLYAALNSPSNNNPNNNLHIPSQSQVEQHIWSAAGLISGGGVTSGGGGPAAVAGASTSGNNTNNTDLAQNANSVENNVDTKPSFTDHVGIEGSETSSSTSSANNQAMISPRHHPQHHETDQQHHQNMPQTSMNNNPSNSALSNIFNNGGQQQQNGGGNNSNLPTFESIQRTLFPHFHQQQHQQNSSMPNVISSNSSSNATATANSFVAALNTIAQQMNGVGNHPNSHHHPSLPPTMQLPLNASVLSTTLGGGNVGRPNSRITKNNGIHNNAVERNNIGGGGPVERRKASTDDFVKNIRQCQMSEEDIRKIEIPVPEAFRFDQNFRPASEEQIIQQIMTSKKYETMDVQETMIQLCKKLAEKRVFGSRLMSETTVAAPNHSNYNNLPDKGIIYILHVCKKVLGPRVKSEDEFWEYFRDAMRKLAARCRRVRHAKKMRTNNLQNHHFVQHNSATATKNNIHANIHNNSNTMVTLAPNIASSPSIFASAQTLVDDERSRSRSSTASNPPTNSSTSHLIINASIISSKNDSKDSNQRPFTPLSTTTATLTPSSSNISPTHPDGAGSPTST